MCRHESQEEFYLMSNRELVSYLITQGFNREDKAVVYSAYAPDCTGITSDGPLQGSSEFVAFFEKQWGNFRNCQMHINFLAAEGEIVAVHYTFSGTSRGTLANFPAGRKICVPGAIFSVIRGARPRICQQYLIWDNLGPLRQGWLASITESHFPKQLA
jgi:predicted ester cyclase